MTYYRGQNTYEYKISDSNQHANVVSMMRSNRAKTIFQDGRRADGRRDPLARLVQNKYRVDIFTRSTNMVGQQRTIIRDCDAMGRLLELNLYIDVKKNSPPNFI